MDRRKFLELGALAGSALALGGLPGCSSAAMEAPAFSSAGRQRVHDLMASYVDSGVVPGMVTLLRRQGELHVDAIGLSAFGGAPMRRDSIFRIASMTKPITAAATMILVEEGKVSLDQPVDEWLPELANRKVLTRPDGPLDDTVPANRAITVRDLLALTMGFGLMFPFDAYPVQKAAIELAVSIVPPRPQASPDPDEWIRRLGTLPLMHQPGEQWMYNTGSDVLGVLIARASGQALDVFLRERIFLPLGMKDTGFSVPPSKLDRLAACYYFNPESGAVELFDDASNSEWNRAPPFLSGAGGLVSTIDDFLAFGAMMLNKGTHEGGRILSAQSVNSMTTDQLTPEQKAVSGLAPGYFANQGWGFGLAMVTGADDVSPRPGRYGWDGGFGTYWFNDPAQDFIGILMTQRSIDDMSPAHAFWKAAFQAMEE
ncbi:MAG TPA: serine hydrolase domain-containing protein [Polyangiaceae bacterium]|nr:serine hydrolase domain-containing protein [Polyangiaceae bacterium]